jgi:hypothetical protein
MKKFVQITNDQGFLFALDEAGGVWKFNPDGWLPLKADRLEAEEVEEPNNWPRQGWSISVREWVCCGCTDDHVIPIGSRIFSVVSNGDIFCETFCEAPKGASR